MHGDDTKSCVECDPLQTNHSMPRSPSVSVVVLSYKRPHLLSQALASVAAQTYRPAEVLIVDNLSPRSGEVAHVVAQFSGFRLIANPTNMGYTGGMNIGLRAAAGDYVVLTEDDIVLSPGAVEAVVDRLEREPDVGLVGGLVLFKQPGSVIVGAGGYVRLGQVFEKRINGQMEIDRNQFAEPFAVSYVHGAFLCAHKRLWDSLGGFQERYFLYMEDVELCVRVAEAGWRIEVVPAARIWHFEPPEGRDPDWLGILKLRNLLRLYLVHARPWILPGFLARYFVWVPIRSLLKGKREGWYPIVAAARTLGELPWLVSERRRALVRSRTAHSLPSALT